MRGVSLSTPNAEQNKGEKEMTQTKTKKALLMSVLSMVLCVAMLVGMTFAWFTDTASTGVNKIQAGNLKMEVTYKNSETNGDFAILNEETNVFKKDTLWEPGHVEYAVLKVANAGNLALKYKLGINIASETGSTNVDGKEFKLSDYIKFAVVDGEADVTDRAKLVTAAEAADSKLIKEGYTSEEGKLVPKDSTSTELKSENTVTLVVWMPESVGNEANYKPGAEAPVINLGINVAATQYTYESDSFGNQYDAGAEYPVASKDDLTKAIDAINESETDNASTIVVTDDFTFTDETLTFSKGDVTLDLSGNKLTISSGEKDGIKVEKGANLTIAGGDGELNIDSGKGRGINLSNTAEATDKTELTIKDVQLSINNNASTKPSIYAYAENGDNNIEINIEKGAKIDINGGRNFAAIQLANNAVLNYNGGEINASGTGSVLVAGRNDAGKDAEDIILNFNDGCINITGGDVIGIECNYFATANMNGGRINITGESNGSYAVGASFGGHININSGEINVNSTKGKAYAVATYGNYSEERKSTVTIAAGSIITLGDSSYNELSDLYLNTVLNDQRN